MPLIFPGTAASTHELVFYISGPLTGGTHRLIGALRRHRKQARLTSATLAALRQLKLQEVAE